MPTANFQVALVSVLQSASPPLAALHATRYRSFHQTQSISPLHCPRCGSLGSSTRIVRPHRKRNNTQSLRVIRRSCLACGNVDEQPCPVSDISAFRKAGVAKTVQQNVVSAANESPPSTLLSAPPSRNLSPLSTPATQPDKSSTRRSKKKAGLQEMLARKRDQEQRRDREGNSSGGLAAFLSGL